MKIPIRISKSLQKLVESRYFTILRLTPIHFGLRHKQNLASNKRIRLSIESVEKFSHSFYFIMMGLICLVDYRS